MSVIKIVPCPHALDIINRQWHFTISPLVGIQFNFLIAQYRHRCSQHAHILNPYECMHTNSTPMSTSVRLCQQISRLIKSPQRHRRLIVDENVTTERTTPLNCKINLGKYEHPCQVKDLNPGG